MNDKQQFATILIILTASMQITAWIMNKNGAVWAFTSLVIGLVAGAILNLKIHVKDKSEKKI